MFGLSASHILIFGLVVLFFGSKRLPELGASVGKGVRAFKAAIDGQSPDAPVQITQVQSSKDKS